MTFLMYMNSRPGRVIRGLVGVAALITAALIGGGVGVVVAVFGLLLAATAVFGICPINPLFGKPMRACAIPPAGSRRSSAH